MCHRRDNAPPEHIPSARDAAKICHARYPEVPDKFIVDDDIAMQAAKKNSPGAKCFFACMFKTLSPVFKENGGIDLDPWKASRAFQNPKVSLV